MEIFREPEPDDFTPVPAYFGSGGIRTVALGRDIGYMETRHVPSACSATEKVRVEVRNQGPFVKLMSILVSAPTTMRAEGERKPHKVLAPSLSLASPGIILNYDDVPWEPYRASVFLVSAERIAEAWDESCGRRMSERVCRLVGSGGEPYLEDVAFNADLRRAFWRAADCPYSGPVRRIYLEGLALELVGFALDEIERDRPPLPRLSRRDAALMAMARERLGAEANAPPSLQELAGGLGISASKLKRDFKAAFGEPVHEFLVRARLEKAKELLDGGGATVKEVAYAVGYRSRSHFSQAFKQLYGRAPSGRD